jgi:UDP-N-acetylglucosamine--N-acetylmuramyl-(pentapeptide) pyrophosphoryl-undecaprenol N-acetylglucosamine transferase
VRIVFAGGGTGGHLFPGVALAQSLGGEALFLCTSRPFDTRQLAHYGYDHVAIEAPRLREALLNPMLMVRTIRKAAILLRAFRAQAVVGLGGYGSAPALMAARTMGIPYALLEQNARPGRTNRLAARGARRVYSQWPDVDRRFGSRFLHTGSPLRSDFRTLRREEARARLGLPSAAPVVGIVGGSQGAQSLNELVLAAWGKLNGAGKRVTFAHLAGPAAAEVARGYASSGLEARVWEFERDMGAFYCACDLVVSRAGGMAIAEMAAAGAAAALVPYPQAAEDHQRANARALGDAAWLVEEPDSLAALVSRLVSRDPQFDNTARKMARHARPSAARDILGDMASWL